DAHAACKPRLRAGDCYLVELGRSRTPYLRANTASFVQDARRASKATGSRQTRSIVVMWTEHRSETCWVPTPELIAQTQLRLNKAGGQHVRYHKADRFSLAVCCISRPHVGVRGPRAGTGTAVHASAGWGAHGGSQPAGRPGVSFSRSDRADAEW